jgi:hypothetical protein
MAVFGRQTQLTARRHRTQHNDIQHNDIRRENKINVTLSIMAVL